MKLIINILFFLYISIVTFSATIMDTNLDRYPERWEKVFASIVKVNKVEVINNSKIVSNDLKKNIIYKVEGTICHHFNGQNEEGTSIRIITNEILEIDNYYFMLLHWNDAELILGLNSIYVLGDIINYIKINYDKDAVSDYKQIVEISQIPLLYIKMKVISDYLSGKKVSKTLSNYLIITYQLLSRKQYNDYIFNLLMIIYNYENIDISTALFIDKEINRSVTWKLESGSNLTWLKSESRKNMLNYFNEKAKNISDKEYFEKELNSFL
jgi:hypothetical protein